MDVHRFNKIIYSRFNQNMELDLIYYTYYIIYLPTSIYSYKYRIILEKNNVDMSSHVARIFFWWWESPDPMTSIKIRSWICPLFLYSIGICNFLQFYLCNIIRIKDLLRRTVCIFDISNIK